MPKKKTSVQAEDDFSAYPHEHNPDPKNFTELILTKSSQTFHILSTSGPNSHPLHAVTVETAFTFNPTLTLHSDPTQASTPVGIVKLGFWRKHNVGYCVGEGREMEWLKVVRVSMLNLKKFEFEYEGRVYVWTTVKAGHYGERPDMELREKGEGEQSLLAFYKGERRIGKMKTGRGVFFLRGKPWSDAGEMEFRKWELVVLLTGLADVEVAAREAGRHPH